MEWVMILMILVGGNNPESFSHYLAGFANEKLCAEAANDFKSEFGKPTAEGTKIEVRAVCRPKKAGKE
ncbi:hypothetical protein LJR220_003047 [Bradyrhizobium sp. LjRoot220]|uniref:hypothetical protein n=1 Tax=Bradyrhizobium sp. LjRoot220 TaxID=3342284 RepID=UPI003ECED7EC